MPNPNIDENTLNESTVGSSSLTATKRFYRPELDVIRFIAFLTVLCSHGLSLDSRSFARQSIVVACGFGLCLFFTLSAYLITTLLLRERAKTGAVYLHSFYKRRMLRILPLYIGALWAAMLLDAYLHQLRNTRGWYLCAFLMLGNLMTTAAVPATVGHLWSISVEEQFYIIWPSLMRRLSRRHMVTAALLLLLISNATLIYFGITHADTWKQIWWNSFVQMEMFAAGILLALRDDIRTPTLRSWPIRIIGFIAIPLAWFAAVYIFHAKGHLAPADGPFHLCIGYALVAASCVLLIDICYGLNRWPNILLYCGKISYGLYVFHILALRVAAHFRQGVPLALVFSFIAASLSYKFFETPFLRLKEKYEVVPSRPV